jgi:xanthine dehydrogenase accessory factor
MPHATMLAQAQAWLDRREPVMEVCVVDAQGSVPRGIGTRMLVAAGETAGTIGGGHLEWVAIDRARDMLSQAGEADAAGSFEGDAIVTRYPLGAALGQCCGGVVTLRTRRLTPAALAQWPAPAPRFTLQVYGAGHVGRAVVRLLEGLECRVQWIDERDEAFPATPSAAHIERVCAEPVEAEVREAPPGSAYLVLTHNHDLDLRITEAVLRRGDFAWLGLIGSATKRARFEHRFEERGLPPGLIARLTCPIGVAGIGGKEPEVIALATVAQLLQATEAALANP